MNVSEPPLTPHAPRPSQKAQQPTPRGSEPSAFRRVAGLSLGVALAIGSTYFIPALASMRPWYPGSDYVPFWNVVGREWLGQGEALEKEATQLADLQRWAQKNPSVSRGKSGRTPGFASTLNPASPSGTAQASKAAPPNSPFASPLPAAPEVTGPMFPAYQGPLSPRPDHGIEPADALDAYYKRLTLVDLGVAGTLARAGHWGDSILGIDGITSAIRRRLQDRFGDGGHGFHLLDRYSPSYHQQGIEFEPSGGWFRCLVVNECDKRHHRYGYGGLIVQSDGGGVSRWATTKKGAGQNASRFELWFARQENGGRFEILVDGKDRVVVDTQGPDLEDAWHEIPVEPGQHEFVVRAVKGSVRGYGIVLETEGPGVVWDGMALIGGSTRGLRTQDPQHIAAQIAHRDLDLVVFLFGGNDMQRNYVDLKESMQPYYDEYGEVIRNFRAGKPGLPCLVMSLLDHGKRNAADEVVSRKFAKDLARAQGEIARQNGCGFFDMYEATGGEGTAARWFRASPRLLSPDLGHPTPLGHEVIAGLLSQAILYGYEQYRMRMVGRPFPELARSFPNLTGSVRPNSAIAPD